MKKKLCGVLACLMLLSCCVFTGCKEKAEPDSGKTGEFSQDGFVNYMGSQMIAAPEGYYAFDDAFLYFITPDFKEKTVVCGKPDCPHNTMESKDMMTYTECDGFFPGSGYPNIAYYEGYLYVLCDSQGGAGDPVIYKVAMDGSERTVFYEGAQFMGGFRIHEGNMYIAELTFQTSGVSNIVKKVSMSDKKDVKVLFEKQDFQNAQINRLDCYGDYCYFYLFGTEGDTGVRYYRVDINSGKTDVLFDTQSEIAYLYMNDYGVLIEDEKIIPQENEAQVDWKSKYYHIEQGKEDLEEITEEAFPALEGMKTLRGMDDKYIYFSTKHSFNSVPAEEALKLYVYTYEGELAAKIPSGILEGKLYWVLPGTDEYMFVQVLSGEDDIIACEHYDYYYIDKSQFQGGEAEMKKIL